MKSKHNTHMIYFNDLLQSPTFAKVNSIVIASFAAYLGVMYRTVFKNCNTTISRPNKIGLKHHIGPLLALSVHTMSEKLEIS